MNQHYLRQFEQRCTQESPPACQTTCPIHVEARTFLELMKAGKVRDARKCLERTMPLASLVGLLCQGHCHGHCVRSRVDKTVNIAFVEKACVLASSPSKPFPLPASGKTIAIVGCSLSGLTVAFELAKKGHGITVFYGASSIEEMEKSLIEELTNNSTKQSAQPSPSQEILEKGLAEALGQLEALHVTFAPIQRQGASFFTDIRQEFSAVYIGLDTSHLSFSPLQDLQAFAPIDGFTLQSAQDGYFIGVHDSFFNHGDPLAIDAERGVGNLRSLFAAGFSVRPPQADEAEGNEGNGRKNRLVHDDAATQDGGALSPIERVAMGKRAAGSIDRFLQGVEAGTARESEFVHPTALYTSTVGVEQVPPVVPFDETNPTLAEGQAEAVRCLQCSCLECVKQCAFLAAFETYPKKLARGIFNGLAIVKGFRQTNKATNSCAECGLCAVVCPNNVDMGEFSARAKKTMVRDKHMPPSAHEFALLDMEQSNGAEVAFLRHQPGFSSSAYLFFPGCQLPATLPQQTAWAYRHLCENMEGGVGLYFHCCGAPARWSGRERLTQATADRIFAQWEESGKPEMIVACASCLEFFKEELSQIPCRSLWEVLDSMALPEVSSQLASFSQHQEDRKQSQQEHKGKQEEQGLFRFTLHDPCAARDEGRTQQAVRHILSQQAVHCEEMEMHGALTRCCGYGGLAASANPSLGEQFAQMRAQDSPLPMIAYCAVCRERLAAEGKASIHLLELLYGVEDMEQALCRKPLGISERQYARKAFRETVLKDIWDEAVAAREKPPFALTYAEGVRELMEQRRIREDDIIMVLEHARKHGPLFKDPQKQWSLASLRPRQVTFWVRYGQTASDEYCVYDAYCHRMLVPGVPGEGKDTPSTVEGFCAKAVC